MEEQITNVARDVNLSSLSKRDTSTLAIGLALILSTHVRAAHAQELPTEALEAPPTEAPPSDAPPPEAPPPAEPPATGATPATPPVGTAEFDARPPVSGGFPTAPPEATPAPTNAPRTVATPAPLAASPAPSASASVATAPPKVAPAPLEPERKRDESWGLFGPFRIGFLVGAGLPNVLSLGGTIKLTRYFGGGVNVGMIPTTRISFYGDATINSQEYDIYGRLYPFGGGFFLGAGVGYQTVSGTLAHAVNIEAYSQMYPELGLGAELAYFGSGSVETMVLIPQFGYLHTFGSGFSFGLDFGIQLPIAPSKIDFKREVVSGLPQDFVDEYLLLYDRKVYDTLETIGRTPLPTVNLRIGWLL